jgi:NAD dependent epimerase/dehydratase family enzyme
MGERSVEVLKSTTVNARKILEIGFHFQHDSIENAIDSFTSKQLSA